MIYLEHTVVSYPQQLRFSLDGDLLTYSFSLEEGEPSHTVNLRDVVRDYSQDHGVIAIGDNKGRPVVVEVTTLSYANRSLRNLNEDGTAWRSSPLAAYRDVSSTFYPACMILTPFKGCDLDSCTLYFFGSPGTITYPATNLSPAATIGQTQVSVNGEPLSAAPAPRLTEFLNSWLPISLVGGSQVAVGGSLALTVVAPDEPEVYLEALAGTLSRSRARNGDVVVLNAANLVPGTTARIKAGYKYWPGKIELSVDVI